MIIERVVMEYISFDKVFLDQENPRHEEYQTQKEVIEYLCSDEYVFQLAKDIKAHGLNPLEIFALIPGNEEGTGDVFIVAEGNRRACALKLLNDPDLAPAQYRKEFHELSEGWEAIEEIPAIRFPSKESVKIWLDRIHGGLQGGIGRKKWNAEQSTRFTGAQKNILAQVILDYAQDKGFLTEEERKGKITTAARYLSNTVFRESLGVESSNIEDVCRTRPQDDFDLLLIKFMRDLVENEKVTSRSNKVMIDNYARELSSQGDISNNRIAPASLNDRSGEEGASGGGGKGKNGKKPESPKKLRTIKSNEKIAVELKELGVNKLESLYYSICTIPLSDHTPLLAIGVWSFIESLSACAGREDSVNIVSFFSKGKLGQYGIVNRDKLKAITTSIGRIQDGANNTKHHEKSAVFDGQQLANDMEVLDIVILKCIEEIK